MVSLVLCPYYHIDKDKLPCQRFIDDKFSTFNAFHVPISSSIHIPLGISSGFVDLPTKEQKERMIMVRSHLYKIDMPQEMLEKHKEKAIKQAIKLLISNGLIKTGNIPVA